MNEAVDTVEVHDLESIRYRDGTAPRHAGLLWRRV
jgi:hypothetical protein